MAAVTVFDNDRILGDFIGLLKDMTSDWDTGVGSEIGADTNIIGDLGFESIDIVQLAVAIEGHFKRRDFPFEQLLMEDGRYVDALYIKDVVRFLSAHLNGSQAS